MPKRFSRCSPTRCGGWPIESPMPRLTLGSRKWIGNNCAWQSVKCRKCTLPKRGSSYIFADAGAAASASRDAIGRPAAAAIASTCRNSRRSIDISSLPLLVGLFRGEARERRDVLFEHLARLPEHDATLRVDDVHLGQRAASAEPAL